MSSSDVCSHSNLVSIYHLPLHLFFLKKKRKKDIYRSSSFFQRHPHRIRTSFQKIPFPFKADPSYPTLKKKRGCLKPPEVCYLSAKLYPPSFPNSREDFRVILVYSIFYSQISPEKQFCLLLNRKYG